MPPQESTTINYDQHGGTEKHGGDTEFSFLNDGTAV
jgi:hypothetical protein